MFLRYLIHIVVLQVWSGMLGAQYGDSGFLVRRGLFL